MAKKKTKKTATKKKSRRKVSKKAKKAEDEDEEEKAEDEDEDEEEKADNPFADEDEDEDKADEEDEEKQEEDEDEEEDEEEEEEDDDEESKSLDALTARAIEDRKRLILAFTSKELKGYAEEIIEAEPMISVKAARKKILAERCERLGDSVGSLPPTPAGKQKNKPQAKAASETTDDDGGIAALTHLIRGAN